MADTPAFLDADRPDVPDLVVPRGILPFHLPGRPVRGRLVRLGPLAEALLARHDSPEIVVRLQGKALALTAGLAGALKFRGSFSLQAKGDGPVSLLLADCTDAGALRGYAQVRAEAHESGQIRDDMSDAALLGEGYLAFTVDQGPDTDRHQGIVAIEGETLAAMAVGYFRASEQIGAWIRLAAARTADGWRAAALILERIAAGDEDAWQTATVLAETLTEAELLDDALAPETLLWRLFGAEGVAADRARALAYGCRCSRQRLTTILAGFGTDDLDHMTVEGEIVMTCEFCNYSFRFPREDVRGKEESERR
ncbi:MAG: Hsp33 family molecular chaperone HslO [Rhodospirillales bacterium]|nr:Hsp33 family molecular chaperone HslO [Rhodospirillales bacterium]